MWNWEIYFRTLRALRANWQKLATRVPVRLVHSAALGYYTETESVTHWVKKDRFVRCFHSSLKIFLGKHRCVAVLKHQLCRNERWVRFQNVWCPYASWCRALFQPSGCELNSLGRLLVVARPNEVENKSTHFWDNCLQPSSCKGFIIESPL